MVKVASPLALEPVVFELKWRQLGFVGHVSIFGLNHGNSCKAAQHTREAHSG
jgi:hypothetical protein